jgi:hypothetical protein
VSEYKSYEERKAEQEARIRRHVDIINDKGLGACTTCGDDMTSLSETLSITIGEPGIGMLAGFTPHLEAMVLVCGNCAAIRLHSSGILDKIEEGRAGK